MIEKQCRFCEHPLQHSFCDLGISPLSNSYLKKADLARKEHVYPLHAYVCEQCYLVQLEEFESPEEIFNDYAYFSSYSDTWLKHAEKYVELMISRFGINTSSQVVEIASNDGYLLRNFVAKNIPVLGIEPAANVAKVAESLGIPTLVKFFGVQTAKELLAAGKQADLLLGNNVLAHVPMLNDFVAGLKILLKPQGLITMEFPHLLQLMHENQFDTIYHEHFSYFSLLTVERIFAKHGLEIFDVEELPTHGGSLRIYAKHKEDHSKAVNQRISQLKQRERQYGLDRMPVYQAFQEKASKTREGLLKFLSHAKTQGKKVVGYGAPAKGNTLLNYCQVGKELIEYTVDRSPHKQGLYLPGTHLSIEKPEAITQTKPDYVLILPWNLKEEIMQQMAHIRSWGGKFVIPLPHVEVI